MTDERLAIRLMIGQAALFAAETAAIHQIGGRLSVMQIALLRGAAGAVLALILARSVRSGVLKTRRPWLQLVRGAVSLVYLWVMIYSFSQLPFADATVISFSQVAYIALFSAIVLRERVTLQRWIAAALAVAGAALIAKPAFAGWNAAYLAALVGAALNGLAFVLNRHLQQEDGQAATMFYTNAVAVLGNLPALFLFAAPAPATWVWLPGVLIFGPLGMYAGIAALRYAEASALAPYTLLRLVIALVGGAIFFRELPDGLSLCGCALVLSGCALAMVTRAGFSWSAPVRRLVERLAPGRSLFGTAR